MAEKQQLITIMDWDTLNYEGFFLEGRPIEENVTLVFSTYALQQLLLRAIRAKVIVLESDGYYRNRGSLERIKGAKNIPTAAKA